MLLEHFLVAGDRRRSGLRPRTPRLRRCRCACIPRRPRGCSHARLPALRGVRSPRRLGGRTDAAPQEERRTRLEGGGRGGYPAALSDALDDKHRRRPLAGGFEGPVWTGSSRMRWAARINRQARHDQGEARATADASWPASLAQVREGRYGSSCSACNDDVDCTTVGVTSPHHVEAEES